MSLEPTAAVQCGVNDLLDRILDKGLVVQADLIISLAGIPLVGVSLRAAIAGMDTMLKYGMLTDWDERSRNWARKGRLPIGESTGAMPRCRGLGATPSFKKSASPGDSETVEQGVRLPY